MFTKLDFESPPVVACVYKWTNLKNGKIYIGETKNLKQRFVGYKSQVRRIQRADIFTKALRKYGFNGFKIEALEFFPLGVSKNILWEREAFWIKFFNATNKGVGYNVCNFGTNSKGTKFSEERLSTLKPWNLGKKHSKEWRDKIGVGNKGKKRTQEQKKLMSEHRIGKPGHNHDEETKKRISASHTGKKKPHVAKSVQQIDKETGEVLREFYSMEDATFFLRGHRSNTSISLAANGKLKTAYGFKWRFAQDVI